MIHIMKYTILEYVRNKIYLSSIVLIFLILAISWMGAQINYNFGDFHITILAFGMNLTELLILAIAIFLPSTHLSIEADRSTAPVLWSKMNSRAKYFSGKFFAFLFLILFLLMLSTTFLGILLAGITKDLTQIFNLLYFLLFQFYQAACILSIVFFLYSIFRNAILSSLLTLLILYFTIFLETAKDIIITSDNTFIKTFYSIIYFSMPQLQYFNIESYIINAKAISFSYIIGAGVYAFVFSGIILALSNIINENKEFQ